MKPTYERIRRDTKNQIVRDIIGACFVIKRKVIEEIGLWDEGFSPIMVKKQIIALGPQKRILPMYVGETEVIHHGASSTKTLSEKFGL